MIELIKALQAAWTGTVKTAAGPLYLAVAPPGSAMPYTVVSPLSSPLETGYRGPLYSENDLQFACYAETATAAAVCITAVTTFLDADSFSISGTRKKYHFVRLGDPLLVAEAIDAQSEKGRYVFGWYVVYRYAVSS